MATLTTVRLNKGDSPSWGFRLQGGKDFGTPLVIQKVNGGSPAERAGLIAGDAVIKINNVDVFNLLHKEAQDVIVRAGSSFDMVIQRGGSTWKPSVVPTGTFPKPSPVINNVSPVTKTSLAANKSENIGAIGTGHNLSARPFNTQVNGAVNGGPKLVNKQYNSPLKLYSEDAIAESLSAQTEVLSTGALGVNFKKNEKGYDASNSEVYRMLQESENDRDTHDEPDSGIVTAPNKGMAGLRHVEAPINRPPPANPQLPPGQNICADCERLIVGVFVRIKDKNLHVECFKCATCGSSLKNVGYYNINNKLYCDIHAKAAAIAINNPSAIPVTIPPGGRAPASAISQALSSHPLPTSQLSPKAPSYTSPYQPAEELKDALPTSDGLSSAPISSLLSVDSTPSTESNIKPSSNSSLFNPSAPISFSKYINKSSNISGPKPFGSVSAPLSPGSNFSRAAPLSPQSNFNKAPVSPSAPSYGSYSPSSTAGRSINITWPPIHEDPEVPTACPLFYPPPSKVEAELEKKVATKHQSKFESEYFADESEDINMDETMSFYSEELSFSGRRSATECVEILSETLDKQKLVENVIKSSPQLILPPLNMDEKKYSTETNGFSSCTMNLPKTEYCQEQDSCALKRPIQYTPNTIECQLPSKVENAVPLKWESSLTQAVRTVAPDLDTFSRIHSRHSRHSASPMASALAIAPAQPFNPLNHGSTEPVPLPEETEPYFPPEIPILPVQFEEKKKDEKPPAPKPKSHFIKALEIAPERPFTPVGGVAALPAVKKKPKDPLDKLIEDLPKPSEKLDMRSALTTAPERSYTPQITEYSTSSDNLTKQQKIHNIDRSQLTKPLKPEELPASFKINIKEPKPPSYYSPAVIEERISSKLQESTSASENKETKIVEKETIQPAEIVQPIITTIQEPQSTNFAPLFQGFTCSFKNKTEHSQFSVEVCTTPPVPTPPPKPQTPISYIATVEQKPGYITREKIIQESSDVRQTTRREENIEHESKLKSETNQQLEIQKQAEEIVQVKTLPVTTMLHKAENIPSYQLDLQATAESELRIMKKKRLAEERLEQQKKEREQKQIQQSMQKNMEYSQEDIKNTQEYSMQQETTQYSQHHQISNQQNMQQISAKLVPVKPERHHITKPIITVEPSEMNNVAEKVSFQGESHDKPPSRTFSPRPRSMTPSMINKAPPLLPYYQDSLVPHYHAAVESNVLEPTTPDISRSPSPHPEMRSQSPSPLPIKARQERAKSPAQGPPPNPLQSSRPLPTREDLKIQQAKENLKTYIPEYKSHQETMEQKMEAYVHRKDQDFQENSSSQISQNVAYPVTCFENQFSVQTGNVQQQVKTIGQQQLQVANTQKHLTEAKKTATGSSTIDYSEESRQEQLAGRCQSQSQSNEKSADGRVQIQRKKIVTEEYERSHKETNIQIEKNITSTAGKYPFTKVNAPSVEPPSVHSFHVTNPHHIKSKDDITTKHTQNTLQQASQKLEESSQSQLAKSDVQIESQLNSDPGTLSQPTAPQPPIRHVYAPNTIAPVKHVSAPSACQKPSQKITKPTIPKTDIGSGTGRQSGGITAAPRRGRGLLNAAAVPGTRVPLCGHCHGQIRGPFITALGKIWCPQHFICATPSCRRPLQDLGFVEEKGQLYCEYCFEQYLAPPCSKCNAKIKGDCLKAIGKNFHPECFNCVYCGKLFANSPFFLEDGNPYCEADWNELFTTKCYACGFPVEAGDRWVEALNNNYHSQCFNCTMCKKNLEGQSFFAKGGRPFCKNHAR